MSNNKTTLPNVELLPSQDPEKVIELCNKFITGEAHLSQSSFAKFMESPNKFIRYKLDPKKKGTAANNEGTLFHTLTLEPHFFDRDFCFDFEEEGENKKPSSANQKKFIDQLYTTGDLVKAYRNSYSMKGKKEAAIESEANELYNSLKSFLTFAKNVNGRILVDKKMYEHCFRLSEVVRGHSKAFELINSIHLSKSNQSGVEVKKEWFYKDLRFLGYMDGYCEDNMMLDLKKTVEATRRKVVGKVDYEGWGNQSAFYSTSIKGGFDIPYWVIAVDNHYQICVLEISKAKRIERIQQVNWFIDKFKECLLNPENFQRSYDYYTAEGFYKY